MDTNKLESRTVFCLTTEHTENTERGNKPMRFGLKRKKENGFSFYALHQNQLLSEVLFSTAGFVSEKSLRGLAFSASLRFVNLRSEISRSEFALSPCLPFFFLFFLLFVS